MDEFEDIMRFFTAHDKHYLRATAELWKGKKETHWIWFIFPQLKVLSQSQTSKYFGLEDINEAQYYYAFAELKEHLHECVDLLLGHKEKGLSPLDILGEVDTLKLKSCLTLFSLATAGQTSYFKTALGKLFGDDYCHVTAEYVK